MRALRSVLISASTLRTRFPNVPEECIILRSLHDVSEAKLLMKDQFPFKMILRDLFDGVPLLDVEEKVREKMHVFMHAWILRPILVSSTSAL